MMSFQDEKNSQFILPPPSTINNNNTKPPSNQTSKINTNQQNSQIRKI